MTEPLRYLRCTVTGWDEKYIYATTEEGNVSVSMNDDTLPAILCDGMQLNLLDSILQDSVITPQLIVVEPDFLLDISSVAACFQSYGHHPATYLFNRMKQSANTQAILLGNFAGSALDDIINHTDFKFSETLRDSFREQALQFCTCEDFNSTRFKQDARQQVTNIQQAVQTLFTSYDSNRALLEPSFVCEQLGLQGRVDLMTDDMQLLVEQKSGKKWGKYQEAHYVQLLLYYGVLHYNFHLSADQLDIRLLYSKYPVDQGLITVDFHQQLFQEAIRLRNQIVAEELRMAREGCKHLFTELTADVLLQNSWKEDFYRHYVRPKLEALLAPLHQLNIQERDFVERMMTFVYREQVAQKKGVQNGQGGAVADLWNMSLAEKQELGNILLGSVLCHDTEHVTLTIDTSSTLPNFRCGDIIYLYRYDGVPDVRQHILYKGIIELLTDQQLTICLSDRQQNKHLFNEGTFAIEHASSDITTTSAIRALMAFCQASKHRRDLLLGVRTPQCDTTRQLSRSYHPHYDEVLKHIFQAQDYFLLQGPPGTGKTSMALRFMVAEELVTTTNSMLLTAYTNRAVDEICEMLVCSHHDFIRIGNRASCDARYHSYLLDEALGEQPRLTDIRQRLQNVRIIVGTTSTLQSRPFIFQLKHFSVCIVDEASQILEPHIIGLLSNESVDRFVLIGDHKQLPAVIQQSDDEPRISICRQSLFERLLQQEKNAGRTSFIGLLRRQGRMHPDIAAFPNTMFYAHEHLEPVPCPHQMEQLLDYHQPSENALDDLIKTHRVMFLDVENTNTAASVTSVLSDKVNPSEARLVADLLHRIYRQYGPDHFDTDHTVGVIVPYRNQVAMIRREIAQLALPLLNHISIDTVERFQGSQRDVIIYSFTVTQPYQLDFLTANCFEEDGRIIDRKLNVAMTRARKQLIMTGNSHVLRQNAVFAQLISQYRICVEDISFSEPPTS